MQQEDRLVCCPEFGSKHRGFFGVFDGTVGDFASDYVHKNIVDNLRKTSSYKSFLSLSKTYRNSLAAEKGAHASSTKNAKKTHNQVINQLCLHMV